MSFEKEIRMTKEISKLTDSMGVEQVNIEIELPFETVVMSAGAYFKDKLNSSLMNDWTLKKDTGAISGKQVSEIRIKVTEIPGTKHNPVINIEVPVPEVTINVPASGKKKTTVKRNSRGEILSMETE